MSYLCTVSIHKIIDETAPGPRFNQRKKERHYSTNFFKYLKRYINMV